MIARLKKSYRTTLEYGNMYVDNFYFEVKVKRANPEWYPWEEWFKVCKISIQFESWAKINPWHIQSKYDDMDEFMEKILGRTLKLYPTRKAMFADLKKLASAWEETYYVNGEERKYEFA